MAPPPPRPPPPPPPPAAQSVDPAQLKMELSPSERVGGRQRDKTSVYAAESEALDQIAKEVSHGIIIKLSISNIRMYVSRISIN